MNENFKDFIESLDPSFQRLMAMETVSISSLPSNMPRAGIYLFTEDGKHLYVGRTNRLKQRLQQHCRPSSKHNIAPFAFRLARNATGNTQASYRQIGSRDELANRPDFQKAFNYAKSRIKKMEIHFVEEAEPMRQALLEMYVSVCLKTPYNDFDTH